MLELLLIEPVTQLFKSGGGILEALGAQLARDEQRSLKGQLRNVDSQNSLIQWKYLLFRYEHRAAWSKYLFGPSLCMQEQ
ncbi:hypothetical protein [Gloeobacter violaceus]|uniref:Gsl4074 protein n=1 Tax=Gloeobacter violaceus (strain ATCC 29082 / PCC 7421) TaxID=251221 RepID=Q7NE06_GLOVI|nr:hypothetical protein [Gloeobacter violaceus]BAC92015.1 gsl4074 [Gloeobacter violaceus PCC 7421]